MDAVTGILAYRQRITLPPHALITVQLLDVSSGNAPPRMLAEQILIAGGHQAPFTFAIEYDQVQVNERHTYLVQATIAVDGVCIFATSVAQAVITQGRSRQVDLQVTLIGPR